MYNYDVNSDAPSHIVAYRKDGEISLEGTGQKVKAVDFVNLIDMMDSDTMLIAEKEKRVMDYEEYNELRDREYLEKLKMFFKKHKDKKTGFLKLRVSLDDGLIVALYNAFKETGQFIEFNENEAEE